MFNIKLKWEFFQLHLNMLIILHSKIKPIYSYFTIGDFLYYPIISFYFKKWEFQQVF